MRAVPSPNLNLKQLLGRLSTVVALAICGANHCSATGPNKSRPMPRLTSSLRSHQPGGSWFSDFKDTIFYSRPDAREIWRIYPDGTGDTFYAYAPYDYAGGEYSVGYGAYDVNLKVANQWIFSFTDYPGGSYWGIYSGDHIPLMVADFRAMAKTTLVAPAYVFAGPTVRVAPAGDFVFFTPQDLFRNFLLLKVPIGGGNNPTQLDSSSTPYSQPSITPDGKVLVVSVGWGPYLNDRSDIFKISTDGKDKTFLTGASIGSPKMNVSPVWNHAGDTIAFMAGDGAKALEIRTMSGKGGNLTTVLAGSLADRWTLCGFSPDDQRIAYTRNGELYSIALDGSEPERFIKSGVPLTFLWTGGQRNSIASFTISPKTVVGGDATNGQITLASSSLVGATISLVSSDPSVIVPATVKIPIGLKTATFAINTLTIADRREVTVTASSDSLKPFGSEVTIMPLIVSSVKVDPNPVVGGFSFTGSVSVSVPAPGTGIQLHLKSSNADLLKIPSVITLAPGQQTATFSGTTINAPTNQSVTVTATAGESTATTSVNVLGQSIKSLTIAPVSVVAGSGVDAIATIQLGSPAAVGGINMNLKSSSAYAVLPSSVFVPEGSTTAVVKVAYSAPPSIEQAQITATWKNYSKSAILIVSALQIVGLTFDPSQVLGGASTHANVSLNDNAQSNFVIALKGDVAKILGVPTTVTIPKRSKSVSFTVTTIAIPTDAIPSLTAKHEQQIYVAQLLVRAPAIRSLTITPSIVFMGSGGKLTGAINLTSPAPKDGLTIQLSSTVPSAVQPPKTVKIAAKGTSVTFDLPFKPVKVNTAVSITATLSGVPSSATVNLVASSVKSLTFSSSPTVGGTQVTGTVTLAAPATEGGQLVTLVSSDSVACPLPAAVTVPNRALTATFVFTATPVAASTSVSVKALTGPIGVTTVLQIVAPSVLEVILTPQTVVGGSATTVTASLRLNGRAPDGGLVVKLESNATVATVPKTVTVPAGATVAWFTVSHKSTPRPTKATIKAGTKSAILTVN